MKLGIKKGNQKKIVGNIPIYYPADRVYLDGDTSKNVQDAVDKSQAMIATVQPNLTAVKTYAKDEQFVYQGLLYKFTTSCAQGGTITIGGNCTLADSVTEQISQEISKHLSVDACIRTLPNMANRTLHIAPTAIEQIFFIVLAGTTDSSPRGIVLRTVLGSGTVSRMYFTYVFGSAGDCTASGSEVIVPHADWSHGIIISDFNFTTRLA